MLLRFWFQLFWVQRRTLGLRRKANGKVQVELMMRDGFFCCNAAAAVRIFSSNQVGSNLCVCISTIRHQLKTIVVVVDIIVDVVVVIVYLLAAVSRWNCGGCGGGCRSGGGVEWTMGLWVDSAAVEFSLDVSVPIVFDFVIGSSR